MRIWMIVLPTANRSARRAVRRGLSKIPAPQPGQLVAPRGSGSRQETQKFGKSASQFGHTSVSDVSSKSHNGQAK
jgi:hypothetical protein